MKEVGGRGGVWGGGGGGGGSLTGPAEVECDIPPLSSLFNSDEMSRVPDQNGVSRLYNMLEIHHSGPEPSIYSCP